jgi:hypothetical protein
MKLNDLIAIALHAGPRVKALYDRIQRVRGKSRDEVLQRLQRPEVVDAIVGSLEKGLSMLDDNVVAEQQAEEVKDPPPNSGGLKIGA